MESLVAARSPFERDVGQDEACPAVVEAYPEMVEELRALGDLGGGE